MKPTKTDVKAILPALDPKWKELDAAAQEEIFAVGERILEAAWERYRERGRYFVAVQIVRYDGFSLNRNDPKAGSVLLGPFVTVGQAEKAARSARVIAGGKYECVAVVLDTQDTTASVWAKSHIDALNHTGDEEDPVVKRVNAVIDPHIVDRLAHPEVCGRPLLDKKLNAIVFCALRHRHPGQCDAPYAPDWDEGDKRWQKITGLTQTIALEDSGDTRITHAEA